MLHVLASLLWIAQAALVAWAVQRMAAGLDLRTLCICAAGVLALGILRSVFEAQGARRVFTKARAQLSELRLEVATSLGSRSPLDRARPASGLAASAMAEQAEALVPYLTRYQPARWRVNVVPLAILAFVLSLSWTAAIVLALTAPLIPLFMAIVGWRAKAASDAQMLELGGMNAFLLDRLRGLSTLRALGAVDATALRLRESARTLGQRTMAVLRIAFLSSAVLELFSALGVAMVAVYVGFHLLGQLDFGTWSGTLSLGEGLFILLLAPAFYEPLRELSAVWHDRAAGEAALAAITHMTRGGVPLPGAGAGKVLQASQVDAAAGPPSVHIRDLVFSHPGEVAFLDDHSLEIQAGEHVALLGPSGSGKTTLLALIAGLVPPRAGSIEIGGVALTDPSAHALRQRMAWMGQRPHIFAGSVLANVSMGRADVQRSDVQDAVRFAALESVAQAYPGAALGEGGSGLSGGEAVRVALARLAVRTQADLLLADEPTAHLDTDTALRVADALVALAKGKTLIVATHDPILASRMHRVIRVGASHEEQVLT
ncbi:thiol reductant ABC exporter subunit CydD [Variovorax sp. J22R133]|uniref:thiol reductant ABC exporter subunit CydD n=1 Tax=Variovorax brevis TaxID=3053503 RepID=UPI00257510CC|nr:thiol reductant ABC exporter subunit CydD [Variovorax sp. J22R133]MDM0115811.1 thiol reductant ABC exporter subunit CydD [Variovorax sp. J22R133]